MRFSSHILAAALSTLPTQGAGRISQHSPWSVGALGEVHLSKFISSISGISSREVSALLGGDIIISSRFDAIAQIKGKKILIEVKSSTSSPKRQRDLGMKQIALYVAGLIAIHQYSTHNISMLVVIPDNGPIEYWVLKKGALYALQKMSQALVSGSLLSVLYYLRQAKNFFEIKNPTEVIL